MTGTELYRKTGKLCKSHTSDVSHWRDEAAGHFHTNSHQSVVEASLRDGNSLVACRAGQRGLLEKVLWYKGADPGNEKGQEHKRQESLYPKCLSSKAATSMSYFIGNIGEGFRWHMDKLLKN